MFNKVAILKRLLRKNRGKGKKDRLEWALVSKRKPKKILRWFGPRKPSEKRIRKEERRIHAFSSLNYNDISSLISVANSLDNLGLIKEADFLDKIIIASSEDPYHGVVLEESGDCGMFAAALLEEMHNANKEANVIIIKDVPDKDEPDHQEVFHICLKHNGSYYDYEGKQNLDDILKKYVPYGGPGKTPDNYIPEEGRDYIIEDISGMTPKQLEDYSLSWTNCYTDNKSEYEAKARNIMKNIGNNAVEWFVHPLQWAVAEGILNPDVLSVFTEDS